MYAKIFSQIFDSSIADDYELRHFFMDLLVLADSDGVVDMTETSISARTRIPLDKVQKFLVTLCNADVRSRTPEDDGKRIKLIDDHRNWGWVIINYDKFRDIASDMQRRERTRLRVQKHRETSRCNASVTQCNTSVTPLSVSVDASESASESAVSSSDARERPSGMPANEQEAVEWAKMENVPPEYSLPIWKQQTGIGFLDGNLRPILNWRGYIASRWSRNKTVVPLDANGKPDHREIKKSKEYAYDKHAKRL